MKRSQMILEIIGQLQDFDSNYNRVSFSEWKEKAEKVLTLIENSEMKPPGYYTETYTEWGVSFNNALYYSPGWEPEDET